MEGENNVGELLNDFYSSLFSSSYPTEFNEVLEGVESRVTQEMTADLLRPFMASAVQAALGQMKANTALGPDGLPPLFYKQYW